MGTMKVMDGNTAAAHVSYAFSEVAAIFPITPSSQMAELVDKWSATGRKNIFGNTVKVKEMQSEAGAAGAVHGSLQGGALTTTYTSAQGLLLMIPNMYKISGELLPGVFHVASRGLGSNVITIFGDHQDVMSTRQTGFCLLSSSNVQQCMDLGAVAHLSALDSRVPVLHFFEGFRTSHELQKIDVLQYEDLAKLVDMEKVEAFRKRALNPDHPELRGVTANPDIFFQYRESVNKFYDAVPDIVQKNMDSIGILTGRTYKLFEYFGAEDAKNVIVVMGAGADTVKETVEYLNKQGESCGVIEVHLFRPFSVKHLREAMPSTVEKVAVLDRTKEPGGREPLYLDVKAAFYGQENAPIIVGGRFGLASKEFLPADVKAIFDNLGKDIPQDDFTVSITDDVTFKSLSRNGEPFDPSPEGTTACKFWGLGSDGTVSANKSAIKIIGEHTDMYVQGYFAYDSKKSGGLTISHLRFGKTPIRARYAIEEADFIACHNQSYVGKYNMLQGMKPGGIFLLNCEWSEEELESRLPNSMKRVLAQSGAEFYTINAAKIAQEIGLGGRINMIMQSAFFALTKILDLESAKFYLKDQVRLNYSKQGAAVIEMNERAIDEGALAFTKIVVPAEWEELIIEPVSHDPNMPEFVDKVIVEMNRQLGDDLPVSTFSGREDGTFPLGISKWEKRGIAAQVPVWDSEKCIQCNQCSFVCPHGVIRPLLLDEKTVNQAPVEMRVKKAVGFKDKQYHLAISNYDCTGCGCCVNACPAKEKALEMKPFDYKNSEFKTLWDYTCNMENDIDENQLTTVKNSQFARPLLEFSGACAGCGETPYVKLVTQLYGDRMMICNPAGCTVVWGASAATAYTTNNRGHGPSYGYSLFEDNAEYGFGMFLGARSNREDTRRKIQAAVQNEIPEGLRVKMNVWLDNYNNSVNTRKIADELTEELEKYTGENDELMEIYKKRDYFVKRSHWLIGGDGWAYDIGFGGIDHVLASGEDVNIMVLDTEVYSNTGGQASKSTPTGAIVKFEAGGKKTCKKDLGVMAMSYGYVYVAQIAMGADKAQTLKAIREAEAYPGPSLIIAYAPCVSHGIKAGMGKSQEQEKLAVDAGYWSLYRYDPRRKENGNNPFIMDSKEPTVPYKDFLMSESRYASLYLQFPDYADALIEKATKDAYDRIENYRRLERG